MRKNIVSHEYAYTYIYAIYMPTRTVKIEFYKLEKGYITKFEHKNIWGCTIMGLLWSITIEYIAVEYFIHQ